MMNENGHVRFIHCCLLHFCYCNIAASGQNSFNQQHWHYKIVTVSALLPSISVQRSSSQINGLTGMASIFYLIWSKYLSTGKSYCQLDVIINFIFSLILKWSLGKEFSRTILNKYSRSRSANSKLLLVNPSKFHSFVVSIKMKWI